MKKTRRHSRNTKWMLSWFLTLVTCATFADDLEIVSFGHNGEIRWTYPTNGVATYRVEWCADVTTGLWCDLQSGVRGIAPTGDTMSASVPMCYRVKAMGHEPANMAYIPAGWFDMGACSDSEARELHDDEFPLHAVYVSGFYMDKYETSKELWDTVYTWATNNNYSFDNSGSGKATNHPVHTMNWRDCVKWANARSEKEGLSPCYFTSPAQTSAYRSGQLSISNGCVNWTANGYRLPTEAEWEKAARGGVTGHRFPWADDTISHGRANYSSTTNYSYDLSSGAGLHPAYRAVSPCTSPVGTFAANAYGLYDMAGSVSEWCWDLHGTTYYSISPVRDPHGPASWPYPWRVIRGGGWGNDAWSCRVEDRSNYKESDAYNHLGFRLVRSAQ